MNPRRIASDALLTLVLTAIYFAGGKLGLSLATLHPSATPVWPPSGIALAAFLLFGKRAWPGVVLGAFLVNLTTEGTIVTSLAIAAGNTLEGWLGALLMRRFAAGTEAFRRPRTAITAFVLAGLLATTVSASIGVTTLAVSGLAPWSSFARLWLTWWLGDAAGAIIFAPFFVLWARGTRWGFVPARALEAVALFLVVFAVGGVVFDDYLGFGSRHFPLAWMPIPLLVWPAFRLGSRATTAVILTLAGIALSGTLRGFGPFARWTPNESLLLLQAYMAALSVTGLLIASIVHERRRFARALEDLNRELEQRVAARTDELRASEARLVEAQHVARVGSWEWDVKNDHLWWSEELYRIYGVDPATFRASFDGFLALLHPDDRDRVRDAVGASLRSGEPFQFEHRVVRPDGDVRTLEAYGYVVRDEAGAATRLLGTGQDVTELRRAEEERTQLRMEQSARREAEEANRLKDEFLATISHELRTPLQALVGWAHLLRRGTLGPAETARAIEVIERNLRSQSRLISDLLDVSRFNSGKLHIARDPVDLVAVIEGALESLAPLVADQSIRLVRTIEPPNGSVLGDADRLQQVVWNLVSNAIKFAPAGGRVEVSLRSEGDVARIEVVDDGVGIEPDFLPHVFEQFRQRDPSSTRRHGGLGLGLAIARRLVELHDGTIAATNGAAGGAVFTVRLPLTPTMVPAAVPVPARANDSVLRGVRVLFVEDDADSREPAVVMLAAHGAVVTPCVNAREAWAAIERGGVDLLVSDIGLPGEDGYALMRRIRALPPERGGDVPAVALSAFATREDAERSAQAGFQLHITKPFRPDELVEVLARLAGRTQPPSRENNA